MANKLLSTGLLSRLTNRLTVKLAQFLIHYKCLPHRRCRYGEYFLLTGNCILCGQASKRPLDLCIHCQKDLPYLQQACPICAWPLPSGVTATTLCSRCLAKPPAFDRCISLLLYQPPASQLINRFKFNKGYAHGRVLATLFSQHLANVYQGSYPDCVIPLPLDYQRLRQRGYNQSAVILHHLSKQLKLKVKNNLVKRIKLTTQQHKLNTRQRKANIKGAFVVNKPLPYEHIAVLDDIVTSGATANEISRVIKQAGVDKVDIWSLARTPLDAQKR